MKRTPLFERHEQLGAKMVEFAGYMMPLHYTNLREEHLCVRNNVGMFDVSHMGEFIVKGRQALDFVQSVSSNDASKLDIGQAQYACLPNDEGGILDDMIVYRLPEDQCAEGEQAFMLVVNASLIDADWRWLNARNDYDCRLIDISDQTALLAVQGPKAAHVLQSLTEVDLAAIGYYRFRKGRFASIDNVLISATGYTGSGGFELYVQRDEALALWDAIMEVGGPQGLQAIGLGARDTLRLEMGFCLSGTDIDARTSPIEAGLAWITKVKKSADFPSKSIFERQKKEGVSRKLVGFVLEDRRAPRNGYPIFSADGTAIGVVTSGTHAPSMDVPIGLGYVEKAYAKVGTPLQIQANRKMLTATVHKLPFFQAN